MNGQLKDVKFKVDEVSPKTMPSSLLTKKTGPVIIRENIAINLKQTKWLNYT